MSQTDNLLAEISGKLDKVLRLLALDVVKGYEKEEERHWSNARCKRRVA